MSITTKAQAAKAIAMAAIWSVIFQPPQTTASLPPSVVPADNFIAKVSHRVLALRLNSITHLTFVISSQMRAAHLGIKRLRLVLP